LNLNSNRFDLDAADQEKIRKAMQRLMYAVGTPVSGSVQRRACVYFRPRTDDDKVFLKIQYGEGCNAGVCIQKQLFNMKKDKSKIDFRLVTIRIMNEQ